MKTLIVDDELNSRENLQILLGDYCDGIEVKGLASNIKEAYDLINSCKPDLVFLDISMPGGSGFDLLKKVPEANFEVIFITAYDNFGIQAIKSNALDYLLKPLSIAELQMAVQKAEKKIADKRGSSDIKYLITELGSKLNHVTKLAIPAADGLIMISMHEIVTLSADGSYTQINLKSGKSILSTRNLKEYESQLPSTTFIRVHHAYIINIEHVNHYHRGEGGTVTMSNGASIMISKRKKKAFLDRFS